MEKEKMNFSLLSPFDPCTSGFLGLGLGKFVVILMVVSFIPSSESVLMSGEGLVMKEIFDLMKRSFLLLFGKDCSPSGLLVSLFSFILVANLLGLIPWSFSITSHMAVNFSLGLVLWLSGVLYSIMSMGFLWTYHFIPQGSPMILSPFLGVVELISSLIRPVSLSVRLMSNMIAGHMILGLMWGVMWEGSIPLIILISILSSAFLLFEVAVAVIQSFVFSTLMSLYWEESTH
uniref:ATP synthase subunit a n=1 Tax=Bovicola bovis TaxID=160097 RepID=A0A386B2B8_9NEOP|nr:ATP synthase F0 subunit 6 [Bovicola bovis]